MTSGSSVWRWAGRAAGAVVTLALVLAALLAFVAPGIIRTRATKGMESATNRKLAIGKLDIHPFTWEVEIGEVSLSEPGGQGTFATFKSGRVAVSPSSIWRGAPVISRVLLVEPHFNAIRTGPSSYNFSDLIPYLIMPVPALSLNDVAITGGSIDFLDRALSREERHTVRDVELLIPFLTTIPSLASQYGNPRIRALIDGAPLVIETQVRGLPRAPEVSAKVDLRDVSLPVYLSYVPARIPVNLDSGKLSIQGTASYRVTGEAGPEVAWDGTIEATGIEVSEPEGPGRFDVSGVAFRSRVSLGRKRGMILEGGSVEIRDVVVPFARSDGMKLGLVVVQGARYSQKDAQLDVAEVLLADGTVRLSRDRKGVFSPMPLLERLQRKLPHGPPSTGEPVRYRVKRVEGRALELVFTDGMRKELPSFTVSDLSFQAEDVIGPLAGPVAFTVAARFGKEARFKAWGKVVSTPLAADVNLDLTGFRVADGGPYLPEGVGVTIADGRLDLRLAAVVATRLDQLSGSFGGSAAIRSLELLDGRRGKLLAWRSLTIDGVKGTLQPMTLRAGRVALSGPRVDLVKGEDGKLNLPGRPQPPAGGEPGKPPGSIQVDQFVLSDGAVHFTDRSVPGAFHATIQDISVRLTGVSSEPGKVADVRAQMTLPKGAPLRVSGTAGPLGTPASVDLDLVLEGLDLSVATPYSGTYLGLEIDRGSLTVKTHARVEQGVLAAENQVRVDQLTFGKAVKSDKATILPVRLLVDILRDRNGDFVLDLPVSARTDDDDLAGTITGQVVKNVILPPGSPLRDVPFARCSAELDTDAQGRLRKLAGALQERPAMKITAVGYVDPGEDGKECREPMNQLAARRAGAVRDFLILQGTVDAARVSSATRDIHAAPRQKGEKQARVEFERTTD